MAFAGGVNDPDRVLPPAELFALPFTVRRNTQSENQTLAAQHAKFYFPPN